MKINASQKTLMRIIGLQMIGYILLEVVAALLIYTGVLPGMLDASFGGNVVVKINTAYLMMVGLVAVLVSGLWTAILVEFEFIEFKNMNLAPKRRTTRKAAPKKKTRKAAKKRTAKKRRR